MVNRRGWLRIVEASIAIMIIFGVLIVVNNTQRFTQEQDLTRLIPPMLEEIARNVTLREHVVTMGVQSQPELTDFVRSRIKQSTIKFEVVICDKSDICSLQNYPTDAVEIYASERIISSTLDDFSPKKVKIFLWYSAN